MQNVVRDSFVIEGGRDALVTAFDPAKDFVYHMTFDTVPAVRWKTPYKDIKVRTPSVNTCMLRHARHCSYMSSWGAEHAHGKLAADCSTL